MGAHASPDGKRWRSACSRPSAALSGSLQPSSNTRYLPGKATLAGELCEARLAGSLMRRGGKLGVSERGRGGGGAHARHPAPVAGSHQAQRLHQVGHLLHHLLGNVGTKGVPPAGAISSRQEMEGHPCSPRCCAWWPPTTVMERSFAQPCCTAIRQSGQQARVLSPMGGESAWPSSKARAPAAASSRRHDRAVVDLVMAHGCFAVGISAPRKVFGHLPRGIAGGAKSRHIIASLPQQDCSGYITHTGRTA